MTASASTSTSPGENPEGGTNAETGCAAPKSAGSVERVVPASAMTAIELGGVRTVFSTVGGGVTGAVVVGAAGGVVATTGTGGVAGDGPGWEGADWAGGDGAVDGGDVVGVGGCVVVGAGTVVVVAGTVVVVAGAVVVVAGAVVVTGTVVVVVPTASAVPAHSNSASNDTDSPAAVMRPRRALRGGVVRNMVSCTRPIQTRLDGAGATRTFRAPLTAVCVAPHDNPRRTDRP